MERNWDQVITLLASEKLGNLESVPLVLSLLIAELVLLEILIASGVKRLTMD